MKRFIRDNGLSLTLLALFALSLVGQALTGWRTHSEELKLHQTAEISLWSYLATGHFISAVFENWESEFLQMAAYVLLTVFLFQKVSQNRKTPTSLSRRKPPHQELGKSSLAGEIRRLCSETLLPLVGSHARGSVRPFILVASCRQ